MRLHRRILLCLATLLATAGPPAAAESPAPPAASTTPSLLLIASRQLTHPSFRETVILVTRHGRGGPLGVIINRPMEIRLDKVFPALPAAEKYVLHEGGPVEPRQISYIFRGREAPAGTLTVADKTFIARSQSLLNELLSGARPHTGLRVVAGFAAWAPGQLENEIRRGDWDVQPVDGGAVFDIPTAAMWGELHRRATQTNARLDLPATDPAPADDGPAPRARMLTSTIATILPR